MTTRTGFEQEMALLKSDLLEMGQLVEEAFEKLLIVFKSKDFEVAEAIVKGDRKINDIEHAIEARCLAIMLRQQPVARDLRIISAALKVVTDMERIGDQAADIAELLAGLRSENSSANAEEITEMTLICKGMVGDSIKSFIDVDIEIAREVMIRDDRVDELFKSVKLSIAENIKGDIDSLDDNINILMIAKYLERIADHAVNICEWAEFYQTGSVNSVRLI
jgi:phosphate transport system regulatory protein PhoU